MIVSALIIAIVVALVATMSLLVSEPLICPYCADQPLPRDQRAAWDLGLVKCARCKLTVADQREPRGLLASGEPPTSGHDRDAR